jgi:hypothetical protein
MRRSDFRQEEIRDLQEKQDPDVPILQQAHAETVICLNEDCVA